LVEIIWNPWHSEAAVNADPQRKVKRMIEAGIKWLKEDTGRSGQNFLACLTYG